MSTAVALTTFTPPLNCLSNTYRYGPNQLVGPMTSTCFPSDWTNTSTTFYSPGRLLRHAVRRKAPYSI
ncbi:hypothetical protein P7C71_g4826, partial [Lecanoromycetidae sp. Uapishka_2]